MDDQIMDVRSILFLFVMGSAISVEHNGIWNPEKCPKQCLCALKESKYEGRKMLKRTDCSELSMTSLPANLSQDTQAFYLSGNQITNTMWHFSHFHSLQELDLRRNKIYDSSVAQFVLPSLRVLDLSQNQLIYVKADSFKGFGNLTTLILCDNKVEIVHKRAFVGLRNLQVLDLSRNRIFELSRDWFQDLVTLRVLNLTHNNINTLQNANFRWLGNLKDLILRGNMIKHIYPQAFVTLRSIGVLDLSHNHISTVPMRALQELETIDKLILDNNHIGKLGAGSFQNTNIRYMSVSRMPVLRIVDYHSFIAVRNLTTLRIAHNPKLSYIDRDAFHKASSLKKLILAYNNLTLLEEQFLSSLSSLSRIDITDNPLICSCVNSWIWLNGNRTYDVQTSNDDPCVKNETLFNNTDTVLSCKPIIMPFFPTVNAYLIGHKAQLECKALGAPSPRAWWHITFKSRQSIKLLPGQSAGFKNHVTVDRTGTLNVDFTESTDQGTYICVAENAYGRTFKTALIRIKNLNAHVIILHVDSTSVTVTWANTHHAHDYELLYALNGPNTTQHEIPIGPYMRSYAISSLKPSTSYDFCIAVKHNEEAFPINCTTVKTKEPGYSDHVYTDARSYIIGGALGFSVSAFVIIVVSACCIRHYQERRRVEDALYGDNMAQMFLSGAESLSDCTPITYENKAAQLFDDDDIEEIRSTSGDPGTMSLC